MYITNNHCVDFSPPKIFKSKNDLIQTKSDKVNLICQLTAANAVQCALYTVNNADNWKFWQVKINS